ncbi:putative Siderochrome-iron transporter [Seiridium cardinale]|uniref:Siderochrome-iron transporter n=1 Tax=Seiridium cardinale TaxID=138064 RepID=A0ABR2YAB2_9PEZI
MTITDKVRDAFRPLPRNSATEHHVTESSSNGSHTDEKGTSGAVPIQDAHTVEVGVSAIDATQAVWGNKCLRLVIIGLAMIMILFELDNSTLYVYNNYSTSSFGQLSTLGNLITATTIIFAVVKPPIAKIFNVIGRGYTLIFTISCYLLAYQNVILSDITSPRWRGLAIGLSYFPFLITPWVSAFIAESVVAENGIGWRWGIGMFAILMPFGASFIIGTLLYYSRKAKKLGVLETRNISLYEFCSEIDLGGICFFVGGCACLLLPLTVAAQLTDGWRTPWIIALLVVGVVLFACLPLYEKRMALYPIIPVGFSATHTYLYAWSTVSYDLDTRTATFLVYTNGVMQCLVGIFAGWCMLWTGRYKWLVMAGTCLRLMGYGIMLRLRTQDSTIGELFGQQLIQGTGSGIISTALLVAPTVVVPRAQIAQVVALVFCCSFLGSSIGATIAGAIYTNTMREELSKWLGAQGMVEMINTLYNSITGVLPEWGSANRIAIDNAYSQVITYITYAAIGASILPVILMVFLPNIELPPDRADITAVSHTYAP